MGDMADLEISRMESGSSIVKNKLTGEEKVIDNIYLMYSNKYDDENVYEISDYVEK